MTALIVGRRYQLLSKVVIYCGFKQGLCTFKWEGSDLPIEEGISSGFCAELVASGLLRDLGEDTPTGGQDG